MSLFDFEFICGRFIHGVFSFRLWPITGVLTLENTPPFYFLPFTLIHNFWLYLDYQAQPKLSLGLLGSDNSEGDSFTVDILVSNNTDEVIVIKSTPVNAYGSFKFPGQIITSGLGQNPAYILEPNDVEWLSVLFTETNEEYSRGFISTENIIEFATLNPSGDQENISAYIRADGEVVLISGLE
jgi:hypothetical protein